MSKDDFFDALAVLFGDIHFLVIAMSRLWRLFEKIRNDLPKEPELDAIAKKYRGFFEKARITRNRVEHLEGMVQDGIPGLGDIRPSSLGFDDKKFDYGPEVEQRIIAFYEEVRNAHQAIARRKGLKPFEKVQGQMRV